MKDFKLAGTIPALALVFSAGAASAASVTPDIIFGSGNANGSFTKTDTELAFPNTANPLSGNLELGLRAKLRYDATSGCNGVGCPKNQFNWDGVDTYSFNQANGNPPPNRAMWNFEWSVNIEDWKYDNGDQVTIPQVVAGGAELVLSFDTDPGAGTTFTDYNLFDFDAYYGTNATENGVASTTNPNGGIYDATGTPVAGSTVAQNSVNYGFLPGAPLGAGLFDIKMTALSFTGNELASTSITVNVAPVPVPAALPLLLAGLGGLGLVARRKRKAA